MGSIDTLVNATIGVYTPDPLMKIPIEDIEPIILSVVMAPMLMCKLVLPLMAERKGGAIINSASDAAKVPTPGETRQSSSTSGHREARQLRLCRSTFLEARPCCVLTLPTSPERDGCLQAA